MISDADFLQIGVPAVLYAAVLARRLEGVVANEPKVFESNPVKAAMTLADSRCQEIILLRLREKFSSAKLLAEEDTPSVSEFSGKARESIVLDPIDGTLLGYLGKAGPYAITLGLARAGKYSVSIVCLPRENLIFYQSFTGIPQMRVGTASPKRAQMVPAGRVILVSQNVPEPVRSVLRDKGYEPTFGSGGAISIAPLVPGIIGGLRMSPGVEGVSIRGRIGVPITLAAGAKAETVSGEFPLSISQSSDHLITASDETTLKDIRDAFGS